MTKTDWLYVAGLATILFALHAPGIENDFVLDSEVVVARNPAVADFDLKALIRSGWWDAAPGDDAPRALYRPVTMIWFAVLHQISSDSPIFNLGNILLHIATAALRYLLVLALLAAAPQRRFFAFLAAAVAGVHAFSAEAVVGVVGAAELLVGLFTALSWLAFAKAHVEASGRRRTGFLALSVGAWLLACLSKENAALFPLVLVLHWLLLPGAEPRTRLRSAAIAFVPFFVAGVAWLAARRAALGSIADFGSRHVYDEFTVLERIASSLAVMGGAYLPKFFWPFGLTPALTHQDVAPPVGLADARVILGLAFWAGTLAATIWGAMRRRSPAALLAAYSVSTLLPTSNLLVPIGAVGAWRFWYSPLFGLVAAVAVFLCRADPVRRLQIRRVGIAVLLLIGVLGAAGSVRLIREWRDAKTLFAAALAENPQSVWALQNDTWTSFLSDNSRSIDERLAACRRFEAIRDRLHRIPSTGDLDPTTRLLAFRILMNHAQFISTIADDRELVAEGLDAAARAVSLARRLEPKLLLDARLVAVNLALRDAEIALSDPSATADACSAAVALADDLLTETEADLAPDAPGELVARVQLLGYQLAALRARVSTDAAEKQRLEAEARQRLDAALEADPTEPTMRLLLAEEELKKRRPRRALQHLERVIDAGRDGVRICFRAAEIAGMLGLRDRQTKLLRRCLELPALHPSEVDLKQRAARVLANGAGR